MFGQNAHIDPSYGTARCLVLEKPYNWYVAGSANVCPIGWHVSTNAEFTQLTDFWGGSEVGGRMMAVTLWDSLNFRGDNVSGFTAFPARRRGHYGNFSGVGKSAYFWTSTRGAGINSPYAWFRNLNNGSNGVISNYDNIELGYSIRCVRD